jgi:hypothetical protein
MATIEPDEAAIFDYRPLIFGSAFLGEEVYLGPNRFYMWLTTTMRKCPLSPDSISANADDFVSKNQVPLDFDIAITVKLADPKGCPKMLKTFGTTNPISVFRKLMLQTYDTDDKTKKIGPSRGEFMSYFREQVKLFHSSVFIAAQNEDGTPSGEASNIEKMTVAYANQFLKANGAGMVVIENVALGKANPPVNVLKAIEDTAAQAQDMKTQHERKRAQDVRAAAEKSKALADRAYIDSLNLPNELYVELKRIEAMEKVCGGQTVCIIGTTPPVVLPNKK